MIVNDDVICVCPQQPIIKCGYDSVYNINWVDDIYVSFE